jgi:ribosomal-protein-alanine N-acetyltransferase
MVGLNVRRADGRDLAKILAVERPSVGSPYWSEAVWADVLSADATLRAVFVAEAGDELLGFVVAARVAKVVEIESIAVAESARRRGVAKTLCAECMAWAQTTGAAQMELEVRASNVGALKLYRLVGFVEQGRRRRYYQAPVEDAVLMAMPLG